MLSNDNVRYSFKDKLNVRSVGSASHVCVDCFPTWVSVQTDKFVTDESNTILE